jgi:CRP/FNR family transcriptional regulator, cyclic AMP receptor protein
MASPMMATATASSQLQVWQNRPKSVAPCRSFQVVEKSGNGEPQDEALSSGMAEPTLRAMQRIEHTVAYPARAILFMDGQPARGVYILRQGRVKLLTANSDGRTLILKIAKPGEALGLNSIITGKPYEMTAEILEPSQLVFIPRADFLKFIAERGDACLHFARHLSHDCQSAYDVIRSIGLCQSVPERLARFLLEWALDGTECNGAVRAKLTLTHEEMGELIGTTRESVTRALSEFKKRRFIEVNGATLLLRNKLALENLAGN